MLKWIFGAELPGGRVIAAAPGVNRPVGLSKPVLAIFCLLLLSGCIAPKLKLDNAPGQADDQLSRLVTSLAEGRVMFWAGGCAACHSAPNAAGTAKLQLGGGLALKSAFGTFRAPNISPDKTHGIGNWSLRQFVDAMIKGVGPDGGHYYPAFPYTSYTRMTTGDVASLWAFMKTLPAVDNHVAPHNVSLALKSRQSAGAWKRVYFRKGKVLRLKSASVEVLRGQYLVEGPGHCGECHTPRNGFGGFDYGRWLAGNNKPEAPNITPHQNGIGGRTREEIAASVLPGSGQTAFFGHGMEMENVRQNMAELSPSDRLAIAAYLLAVPAVE